MASKKSVVIAALIANGGIAIMKFVAFLMTGSPSMLSETYHSISDTGNQVFLLIGIRYSKKSADSSQPFGYGKAQFFYSFLVSVLLFGIAGWESAKHGYQKLTSHGHGGGATDPTIPFTDITLGFDPVYLTYAVLIGAIVFESWALWKANKGLKRQMKENDWNSYREAFRKTPDVTTLTAFTEDSIALAGAAIALVGIFLARQTGIEAFDAAAALIIGLMLMGFAIALAWENKRLLLGESLPDEDENRLREIARNWEGVEELVDLRTVYFGPNQILLTADLTFSADMTADDIDTAITDIESEMRTVDEDLDRIYIEPGS
jgi:cation diffusion facilitator family transporter